MRNHKNLALQMAHFANIDHDKRAKWQLEDQFVMAREHRTIAPLVEVIKNYAKRSASVRVFESGCGEGVNIVHLQQQGIVGDNFIFEGADVSPEPVAEAIRRGIKATVADGLALPQPDNTFDVAFTRDVLHHLGNDDERRQFFSELKRITKPGGSIVIIEPNPWNPMLFWFSILVSAEKGIRTGRESRHTKLLPDATVKRTTPSAAWRGWYHYRSPLRDWKLTAGLTRWFLERWEWLCEFAPSHFWSWRVYIWKK